MEADSLCAAATCCCCWARWLWLWLWLWPLREARGGSRPCGGKAETIDTARPFTFVVAARLAVSRNCDAIESSTRARELGRPSIVRYAAATAD